jgi:uncharacterized protein (DUF736 family)
MVVSGLQHISKSLDAKDTTSIQRWLMTVGASMPDIDTIERKIMEEQKPRYVPLELKGRITPNRYKTKETSPDYMGEIMVKGVHIKFGVWEKDGPYGKYFSISVSDPEWKKTQNSGNYPKEVNYNSDSDVPF